MDESVLLITVRLLDGRFHGLPEWPPSPFRLYQALVAGALLGESGDRVEAIRSAFEWLENLPPPSVAVPPHRRGSRLLAYVPNNDLDTVGGDPRFVSKIRGATKRIHPRLLAADAPFAYLWRFDDERSQHEQADRIVEIVRRVFQFGRGVDMAYASGVTLSSQEADDRLRSLRLVAYLPRRTGKDGSKLRVPAGTSFQSLLDRYDAQRSRFRDGHLAQALPPTFDVAYYGSPSTPLLFDLITQEAGRSRFYSVPAVKAFRLVERIRDLLAHLLKPSFGESLVERVIVGLSSRESDKAVRLQIIPIPSIGSDYADHAVRRVLLMVPPDCPIPVDEIEWAAGIVHLGVTEDGELADPAQPQLVRATDEKMLEHYAIHRPSVLWRTVTPMVLPPRDLRGGEGARARKPHDARITIEAVRNALRHAGIKAPVSAIRLQKEPFEARGTMARSFEVPPRFAGRRRYHVEITFAEAHEGPLILGDGRYVGLGLFAPGKDIWGDAFVFDLPSDKQIDAEHRGRLIDTARRALMALAANARGDIPRLFSGHEHDGAPAGSGRHEHVFLAIETKGDTSQRLLVVAPWLADHSFVPKRWEREQFDKVVRSLKWLGGREVHSVRLPPARTPDDGDPVFGSAYGWETCTPYRPTIHPKLRDAEAIIRRDVVNECQRRGLPVPSVHLLQFDHGPKGGNVTARLKVEFRVAVRGPIMLGNDSHVGGGLFRAKDTSPVNASS